MGAAGGRAEGLMGALTGGARGRKGPWNGMEGPEGEGEDVKIGEVGEIGDVVILEGAFGRSLWREEW